MFNNYSKVITVMDRDFSCHISETMQSVCEGPWISNEHQSLAEFLNPTKVSIVDTLENIGKELVDSGEYKIFGKYQKIIIYPTASDTVDKNRLPELLRISWKLLEDGGEIQIVENREEFFTLLSTSGFTIPSTVESDKTEIGFDLAKFIYHNINDRSFSLIKPKFEI